MLFGSPTVSINWFIYLLALLAPVVWPNAQPVLPHVTEGGRAEPVPA
jgi:hypothetical protein